MPLTLSYDQALEGLKAAIAEKGENYTYNNSGGCTYFNNGQPSCIVGHVLASHGATPADLAEGTSVLGLVQNGVLAVDETTEELLTQVQIGQDSGIPWGQAFSDAIDGQ